MWTLLAKLLGKSPTWLQQTTDTAVLADNSGTCPGNYSKPGNVEQCQTALKGLKMYSNMDNTGDLLDSQSDQYTLDRNECENTAKTSKASHYAFTEAGADNCKVSNVLNPNIPPSGEYQMYKYGPKEIQMANSSNNLTGCYLNMASNVGVYNGSPNGKATVEGQKSVCLATSETAGGATGETTGETNYSLATIIIICICIAAFVGGCLLVVKNWDKIKASGKEEYLLSTIPEGSMEELSSLTRLSQM